jgi:hypothetical protein
MNPSASRTKFRSSSWASVENAASDLRDGFRSFKRMAGLEVICWAESNSFARCLFLGRSPIMVAERAQITEPPGSLCLDGLQELRSAPAGRSHDAQFPKWSPDQGALRTGFARGFGLVIFMVASRA